MRGAASFEAAPEDPLERDVDRNSLAGIPAVVHVVAVVDIVDIYVVVVVPVISPGLRPGVDGADPVALVLEAWVSAHDQEGEGVDAESMARPEVSAIAVIRNAITVVAPTLLPGAVIGLPVLGSMLLPGALLDAPLLLRGPLPVVLGLLLSLRLLLLVTLGLLLVLLRMLSLVALGLLLLLLRVLLLVALSLLLLRVLLLLVVLGLLLSVLLFRLRVSLRPLGRLPPLLTVLLFVPTLLVPALLSSGMVVAVLLLRVGGSSDSEQQRQNRCAGDSNYLHSVSPISAVYMRLFYCRLPVVAFTGLPMASPDTRSSTLRFCCRPAELPLEATGKVLPKPFALTEVVTTPCCTR
jgi:hypothetical protein